MIDSMHGYARVSALVAALILGAPLFSHAQPASPSSAPTSIVRAEHQAEEIIAKLINEERARFAPDALELQANGELDRIARERSGYMAHGGPFAHEDAQGRPVAMDQIKSRVSLYGYFGENIMMEKWENLSFDALRFAREAVDGWMASEGHRANILSPNYDRSGIGVIINGNSAYATQVFYGPQRDAPQPGLRR
jgi:uncharacterized protein YkwD